MISIKETAIFELFKAQAALRPDTPAIVSAGKETVTYGRLLQLADIVSQRLEACGDVAGSDVFLEYSSYAGMAAGIFGVLQVGGRFVLVPSRYPAELRNKILDDCDPDFTVTVEARDASASSRRASGFHEDGNHSFPESGGVIYLPGNFPAVEGLVVSGRYLAGWARFHLEKLKVDASATLFIASPHGEAGFPVWLASILSGGCVSIVPSGGNIREFNLPRPVTSLVCPLHMLADGECALALLEAAGNGVKNLVTYGEQSFDANHVKRLSKERSLRWHNYFGFPEVGLVTTLSADEHDGEFRHVGRPVVGTSAWILNPALQKVPVGVTGALYMAGNGVFDGYSRNLPSGEARFAPDPAIPGGKMFDTGIKARWLEDGKISLLGYGDDIISLNGTRIHLGNLEALLGGHPAILDCAVYFEDRDRDCRKPLASVVSEAHVPPARLNAFLKQYLPADFPDLEFVSIASIPRTGDGNIDRRTLAKGRYAGSRAAEVLEEALVSMERIESAVVLFAEKIDPQTPYHLDDVLPLLASADGVGGPESEDSQDDGLPSDSQDDDQWEPALSEGGDLPDDPVAPEILPDALFNAASRHPKHKIICIQPDGSDVAITYEALLDTALRVKAGLQSLGLKAGDKAIFQTSSNQDYIAAFWGCTLGGIVPVPLNVPKSFTQPNNETRSLENIWNLLEQPLIIASDNLEDALRGFSPAMRVGTLGNLKGHRPVGGAVRNHPEEPALILFTSGSTGTPKGVVQCHRSILARERGAIHFCDLTSDEITLNWLALEHVVGLLMFHIKEVVLGCTQVHVKTDYILAEPLRWLELISKYRVTNIFAPNFAFALLNDRLEKTEAGDWDLTPLRIVNVGAEAIDAANMKKFLRQLQPYGLAKTAVHPSWGMSETSSGVVYSKIFRLGNDDGVHTVEKASLTGKIKHCQPNVDSVTLTEVGKPFPGVSLRIVDFNGDLKAEGEVGRLHIKGLTITSGYYKNPELNRQVFTEDGWFDTGDLAFIYKKGLTITGRVKDVIIINGVNYNNGDIESTVETVPEVELSFTAACAVRPAGKVGDKLAIFYNSSLTDFRAIVEQTKEIVATVNKKVGIHPDFVIPVTKEDIPKTSIGKIQRSKLVTRFEEGDFAHILKKIDIALENKSTIPRWFFSHQWRQRRLGPAGMRRASDCIIVFADDAGLAEASIPLLDGVAVRVTNGSEFKQISECHYMIDPGEPGHYSRLLDDVERSSGSITEIIHLPGYPLLHVPLTGESMEHCLRRGVYQLLLLIQALDRRNCSRMRLLAVTGLGQATGREDRVAVERSPISGFLKSLVHEIPWLQCSHIDLEALDLNQDAADLIHEWRLAFPAQEVAYRQGERLVPVLEAVKIEEGALPSRVKQDGLYLVTGGLGGVGRLVSRWLQERFGARLLIAGRRDLPPREDWDGLIESGSPDTSRLAVFRELEKKGAVIYGAGDAADERFLRELVKKGEQEFGRPLDGVFHLAGVGNPKDYWQHSHDFYAVNGSPESYAAVFRSKIFGAITLNRILADRPDALLVCFSSIISEFGASAYCPYAAANSFLDSLPAARQAADARANTLTINWSSWENIGVNEGLPAPLVRMMEQNGFRVMDHARGLHTLDIALTLPLNRLLVGLNSHCVAIRRRMNLVPGSRQWLRVFYAGQSGRLPEEKLVMGTVQSKLAQLVGDTGSFASALYPLESLPKKEGEIDFHQLSAIVAASASVAEEDDSPLSEAESRMVAIWKEILGLEKIHRSDNFFELGGNSLKAITLAAKIHKDLDIELPLGKIFEIPTIKELSQYIDFAGRSVEQEIPPAEKKKYYVCSPAQKRMFVLHRMNPEGVVYNMPALRLLVGELNPDKFQETFRLLVDRHESLRTSFHLIDGEPFQQVYDETAFEVELLPQDDPVLLAKRFIRPFQLDEAPLLRVALAPTGPDSHLFMMDMHHIVSDGVSMGIIIRDFMALYEGKELEEIRLHYKDFAEWQDLPGQRERLLEQLEFWRGRFSDGIPVLELPLDHSRQAELDFAGGAESFFLDADLTTVLAKIAQTTESTLYMVLLAMFYVLLSRLSGQEDVVIGTPVAGRRHADVQRMVGMFVNTLALRGAPSGELGFREFLNIVKTNTLEAFQHQDVPFEELVETLDIRRDASRNPLFDVLFVMQNQDAADKEEIEASLGGGLAIKDFPREENVTKFDLQLNCLQEASGLRFTMRYRRLLFEPSSIRRFNGYFQRIVAAVVEAPDCLLGEIDILTSRERDWLLTELNDTAAAYPKEQTLAGLFAAQAGDWPNRLAVVLGDLHLTYGRLYAGAREWALQLAAHGVEANGIVAIMMERSLDMATAILAVHMAGAAYLPMDPGYPQQRSARIMADSGAEILLFNEGVTPPSCHAKPRWKNLRVAGGQWLEQSEELFEGQLQAPTAESLAYIIYTSGSTGLPKGVAVEHRPVVNLIHHQKRVYDVECGERFVLFANICFDASVQQIFLPLLSGLALVMVKREILLDLELFQQELVRQQVTQIHAVPSFLNQLDPNLNFSLKRVLSGGEVCPPALARQWAGRCDFFNRYGPTETAIAVLEWKASQGEDGIGRVPVGYPISNTKIYVLDRWLKPVPVGVAGELYIGGDCMARGYLNRPELTAERFVVLPETLNPGPEPGVFYRSGDLVRRREDGAIEFLSRIDHQVKIRGYRIELGEIEAALDSNPAVSEAVVVVLNQDDEDASLAAYVCMDGAASPDTGILVQKLKDYLASRLPDYMIPPFIMIIEDMPRTISGKVDRRRLPEPGAPEKEEMVAPRNEIERRLAAVWSSVLRLPEEAADVTANFFDSGGHSLKAVQLVSRIHKEFGVKIPLIEIFKHNTIETLSRIIVRSEKQTFAAILPAPVQDEYPLSSAQKRMLILHEMDPGGVAYNIPVFRLWKGEIDLQRLNDVFCRLIQRHEAFRTSFHMVGDRPVQRVAAEIEFAVDVQDNPVTASVEDRARLIRPFRLEEAPLMRVSLIRLEEGDHLFFIDMHHIIADGLSTAVLVEDFTALYKGGDLSPLAIQYKDFAYWQQSREQAERLAEQAEYWAGLFKGDIPVLNLPCDFPRPPVRSFAGDVHYFQLPADLKARLEELGRRQDATSFMVLLAAFNVLLARLSGQEGIVVGTPVAGRRHADLEPVVGVFVNSLGIRSCPQDQKSFLQLLSEIRQHSIEAFDRQEYPFEDLVERLQVNRDTSRNPLFDVMFGYHEQAAASRDLASFLEPLDSPRRISKFDLMLTAVEEEDGLRFSLEYCTALFKRETVEKFSGYFLRIVRAIIEQPALRIGDVPLLSGVERQQILESSRQTDVPLPLDGTVLSAFLRHVENSPERVALVAGDRTLSYRDFYNGAAAIARRLKAAGIARGSIVAVMTPRSPEMLMGIYGAMLAGGAYLPIDPRYPADRIHFVLEDSDAACLLTYSSDAPDTSPATIYLDTLNLEDQDGESSLPAVGPEDPAYVIYTSGTTGRPKGVLIQHGSLMNRLCWMQESYPLEGNDVILQKTTVTFDVSVWELFWWAMAGASVCLLEPGGEKDPDLILSAVEDHRVTVMHFVPSMLGIFLDALERQDFRPAEHFSLRRVFASGEALLAPQVQKFYSVLSPQGQVRLVNLYGPTEATVDVSYFDCPPEGNLVSVPIGKPIWNTRLFVTDRRGRLQPPGVAGELWIAGMGLARGYLNRPELTAEKFIVAEYLDGQRVYRSGDLARLRQDGEIEFLGRIDHQVKIRGYRIELGEIESLLLKHPLIDECAVLALGSGDGAYLCAYTVTREDSTDQVFEAYLEASLPDYMIPSRFVRLRELPVTANGKLDRRALPEPELSTGQDYVAPVSHVEETLVSLWAEVLGIERQSVGVESGFFQLGGQSLKAVQLAFKIHERFGVRLSVLDIFKTPTIRGLSRRLNGAGNDRYQSIPLAPAQEYYRLSAAQRRIYLTQQMDPDGTGFNMTGLLELQGAVDEKKLESMFRQLIRRHEVLRASFEVVDNQYIQRILSDVDFNIHYLETDEETLPARIKEFTRPFELDSPPLFRVSLYRIGDSRRVMALDIHHIVSDGISADLLVKDALALYRGEILTPLSVQYKDYAEWTHDRLAAESMEAQRRFWLEEFSGQLPVLEVPIDFKRPDRKCFKGEYHYFAIPPDLGVEFKRLLQRSDATLFMGLMAIYYVLLSKYSRQEDIVIGTTVDGRWHPDLQPVIGIFVNMLAIRTAPTGDLTFRGFLESVRAKVLAVMGNQDYQYEDLIRELGLQGAVDRDPLFSAVFNMQLEGGDEIDTGDFIARPYKTRRDNTVFDIILNGVEAGDGIQMTLILSRALFKPETGVKMTGHFVEILRQAAAEPDMLLKDIKLSLQLKVMESNVGVFEQGDFEF